MLASFLRCHNFHHGALEPHCVELSTRVGGGGGLYYARDKNTSTRLSAKNAGGGGRICGTLRYSLCVADCAAVTISGRAYATYIAFKPLHTEMIYVPDQKCCTKFAEFSLSHEQHKISSLQLPPS